MKIRFLVALAGLAMSFAVAAAMSQDAMKVVTVDELVWRAPGVQGRANRHPGRRSAESRDNRWRQVSTDLSVKYRMVSIL
jgi:hypothetical protein